uniref:putative uncharacterized protein encoded by MIR1915-HG n=1 Tax=Jaculus jaculus TaxID=51337 RepID=UPI001E1B3D6F|nr:putative uncharacterized protein encoded by MIR1915-HG [Jaculus jaculus]
MGRGEGPQAGAWSAVRARGWGGRGRDGARGRGGRGRRRVRARGGAGSEAASARARGRVSLPGAAAGLRRLRRARDGPERRRVALPEVSARPGRERCAAAAAAGAFPARGSERRCAAMPPT